MSTKRRTIPRREHSEPHPGGWVDLVATTDVGGHCELEIHRALDSDRPWFDPDPRVDINFRRHKSVFHPDDREPDWATEWIEGIRASDLDGLVQALQQGIAVARFHGIIPGPLSDDATRALLKAAGYLSENLTPPASPVEPAEDDDDEGDEWKKQDGAE